MKQNDPTDIQDQARRKAEADRKELLKRNQATNDLKAVMGTQQGRRFVRRLLERAGLYHCSFSPQALDMAFAEGRRNQGLSLLADIQAACPGLYITMLQEQQQDDADDN